VFIFIKISDSEDHLIKRTVTTYLIENHYPFNDTVIVGLQPRGIFLADKIVAAIHENYPAIKLPYGKLDITFYRDDVHKELHIANQTTIDFDIENKNVILIDDVLYTGRTIRAAMDALVDFGRPAKVELLVLVDRRFNRQLPIQPDYTGKAIDSILSQKVTVDWEKPEVVLL
jgi:pyrimidine operon attenuation protein / uracil phosphoribosyltransferase